MSDSHPIQIAPSILSANFANLAEEIYKVEEGGADLLHIDVMDGHFVPNITIGPPVVKSLKKIARIPFDVHLMIEHPEQFIEDFQQAGTKILTIHQEVCYHLSPITTFQTSLDSFHHPSP